MTQQEDQTAKMDGGERRGGVREGDIYRAKSASHPRTSPKGRKSDMVIHGIATCGLLHWDSFQEFSNSRQHLEIFCESLMSIMGLSELT